MFLLGAAAGVAVDRFALGIEDAQAAAIRPILVERIRQTSGVLERVDPELDAIRRAGDDQVRALLRPDQRAGLDALRAEFEARRAEVRRRLRTASRRRPDRLCGMERA